MRRESSLRGNWHRSAVFLLVVILAVGADQLSKSWIRSNLAFGRSIPETGLPRLTHIQNTGAAFGLFQGQSFALTIVAIVGIVFILVLAFAFHRRYTFLDSRLGRLSLGLILGGTIGNLIDRLLLGHVTDFIDVGFWPAFNVADSAVVVGTILFAYRLFSIAKTAEQ